VLRGVLAGARRLEPHARFVAARLTPGGLGLGFTSLLAILAVSLYILVAYTVLISGDPGPTAGDRAAIDAAHNLQTGWLTDVAKAVSDLGATAVIVPLSGVVAALLAIRRRWADAAVLVIATVITFVGVGVLKDATARPRPTGALTSADGSAFPSGHAAHAILYPWLALILTVRLRPRMAGRSAILVLGVVIAVAVGLARVYLRVHYLSDVSAGWALGVAAFAACAAVAMTVMYLRHNGERDGPPGSRD
jgi:undecaprenyl-diphosphatase